MWRARRVAEGDPAAEAGARARDRLAPAAIMDPSDSIAPAKGSGIGKRRSAAKEDSSASYQARREEIAEAAVRVFNRLGFQKASISAVAAELDIDRASLYYYISSKEELFDEIVRRIVERNAAIAKQILTSDATPKQKLEQIIIALMKSYGDHYPLMYIYIRENLSHVSDKRSEWSRYMRSLNNETSKAIIAVIEEGYADGSFRNIGPSRIVAYGVFGLIGWTNRWFRPGESEVSAEEIGRTYAAMAVAGLVA